MMRSKHCSHCGQPLHWYDKCLVLDVPWKPGIDRHPPRGWYRCMNCGWSGRPEHPKREKG